MIYERIPTSLGSLSSLIHPKPQPGALFVHSSFTFRPKKGLEILNNSVNLQRSKVAHLVHNKITIQLGTCGVLIAPCISYILNLPPNPVTVANKGLEVLVALLKLQSSFFSRSGCYTLLQGGHSCKIHMYAYNTMHACLCVIYVYM